MMRQFSLHLLTSLSLVVLLLPACSNDTGNSPGTALAPTTIASDTTTTAASETKTAPPTTAAVNTTVDPARLPDPVAMEQLVHSYYSAWPDVEGFLAEDVAFVDVSADGWVAPGEPGEYFCYVSEVDEGIVHGRSDVVAALDATGFSKIDYGGPSVISADWIATPVSASRPDGSGEEGIWVLRIVDDKISSQLNYATDTTQVSPAASAPDPTIETETCDFCAMFEGTGYVRSAADVIAAMTDDPAIHNIPNSIHCGEGAEGVEDDVATYLLHDNIFCGAVTTNGQWSAQASTIENPEVDIGLVGILVRQHIDGQIHRQYNQYTQTSGPGNWGLHLDDE